MHTLRCTVRFASFFYTPSFLWTQNLCWPKFSFWLKFSCGQIFLYQKIFFTNIFQKLIFWPTKFVIPIFLFRPNINFLSKIFLTRFSLTNIYFLPNTFFDPKIISPKDLMAKYFLPEIIFDHQFPHQIFSTNNSLTKIYFWQMFLTKNFRLHFQQP